MAKNERNIKPVRMANGNNAPIPLQTRKIFVHLQNTHYLLKFITGYNKKLQLSNAAIREEFLNELIIFSKD